MRARSLFQESQMFQPAEALALASENPAKLRCSGQAGQRAKCLFVLSSQFLGCVTQGELLEVQGVAAGWQSFHC